MAHSFHNLPSLRLIYFLFLLPLANSVLFNISSFENDKRNIVYEGDAKASAGAIEFNLVTCPARVGSAAYAERIPLWDSYTNQVSDFTTHFSFLINTQDHVPYGNGLAFFIAADGFQIPQNSEGGYLTLLTPQLVTRPQNQIVMVEFDAYKNHEWDPHDVHGHVGINNNSISSAIYTSWNAMFHSGDTAHVRITYNATTKNLSVARIL